MSEVLKIQIGADVEQAVANIKQFAKTMQVEIGKTEGVLEAFERELKVAEDSLKSLSGNALLQATSRIQSLKTAISQIKTNQLVGGLQNVGKATGQANTALVNFGRVVQDAPFGLIGIANNIDPLVASFGQLKRETGSTGGALKALAQQLAGPAGIAIGISAVTSLLVAFGPQIAEFFGSVDQAAIDAKKAAENFAAAADSISGEASTVETLVAVLKSETTARKEKIAALAELKRINPEYFGDLKIEDGLVKGLDDKYKDYKDSLLNIARAKATQAKIQELYNKRLAEEDKINKDALESALRKTKQTNDAIEKAIRSGKPLPLAPVLTPDEQAALGAQNRINEIDRQINELADKTLPAYRKQKEETTRVDKEGNIELSETGRLTQLVTRELSAQEQAIKKIIEARKQAAITKDATALVNAANGTQTAPLDLARNNTATFGITATTTKQKVDDLNKSLQELAVLGATNVAEAFGELLAGGNPFQNFATFIATSLQALGKQLVIVGGLAQKVQIALASLFANPTLAIAAGLGLIAAGAALKAALNKGIQARANGGPVGGGSPFIVGERGPELFVPNQSGRIINNAAMLGGGGMQIIPTLEFSYDQLRIAFKRVNASAGRRF